MKSIGIMQYRNQTVQDCKVLLGERLLDEAEIFLMSKNISSKKDKEMFDLIY